jgi:chemotaxis signal transduction protein
MGTEQQGNMQTTPPATTVSRFCYRVGQHSVLLESGMMAEVLVNQTLYPVPFAPDWCAGLISLRGDLFPVIDMHKVLLDEQAPGNPSLLLIQHKQFTPVALTCDGYPFQLRLPEDEQQESGNLPGWIPHAFMHNGQRLLAADHGRLLRQIQHLSGTHKKDPSGIN